MANERADCPEGGSSQRRNYFKNRVLHEEIQDKKQGTQEQQKGRGGYRAARNAPHRAREVGRNGLQAGLSSHSIKGADHGVPRKKAATNIANFLVNPQKNIIAPTPYNDQARDECRVTNNGKQP